MLLSHESKLDSTKKVVLIELVFVNLAEDNITQPNTVSTLNRMSSSI